MLRECGELVRRGRIRRTERVEVEKEKGVMVKRVGVCGGTEEKNVGNDEEGRN